MVYLLCNDATNSSYDEEHDNSAKFKQIIPVTNRESPSMMNSVREHKPEQKQARNKQCFEDRSNNYSPQILREVHNSEERVIVQDEQDGQRDRRDLLKVPRHRLVAPQENERQNQHNAGNEQVNE